MTDQELYQQYLKETGQAKQSDERALYEQYLKETGQSKEEKVASDSDSFYGLKRGLVDAIPAGGAMAGAVMGAPLGPLGILGGGVLGAMGGKALEQGIEGQVYGVKKSNEEKIKEIGQEGLLDAIGGPVASGIGRVGKGIYKQGAGLLGRFNQPAKEGAKEIAEAAERLGGKATPGMLTENKFVQNMESGVAQKPTKTGIKYAENYQNLDKAMKAEASGLLQPHAKMGTQNQLAEQAKQSIEKEIDKRLEKSTAIYERLSSDGKHIPLHEKGSKTIAKNIENLPYAKIEGSASSGFTKNIANSLRNAKDLSALRNLKSYVGQTIRDRSAPSELRHTAGEIYGKLAEAEKRSITRASLEAAKNARQGKSIAKEMIAELKSANMDYANLSKDLQELSSKIGLGKVRNYADFIANLNKLSDEQVVGKLFKTSNAKQLQELNRVFPQAFEKMKSSHMIGLYNDSITKGEISLPKLINNVKRMSPEARKIVFGDGANQKLKDIETVYNAIPRRIGPSGTPEGLQIMEFSIINPKSWWAELNDKSTDYILNNPRLFNEAQKRSQTMPYDDLNRALKGQLIGPQIPRSMGYNQDE